MIRSQIIHELAKYVLPYRYPNILKLPTEELEAMLKSYQN